MSHYFIGHYGEIGLKGRNRRKFEKQLATNIRKSLKRRFPNTEFSIQFLKKRLILKFEQEVDNSSVSDVLIHVFGLVNFAPAQVVSLELNEIESTCLNLMEHQNYASFAIETKRSNKNFPLTSEQINARLGRAVVQKYQKEVNLTHPEKICYIEILKDSAIIYTDKIQAAGGLPVSSGGDVLVLLSGGLDSPVAAYYSLKRGAYCKFVHFHAYPYTTQLAQEKVLDLVKLLNRYQFRSRIYMVPFGETQSEIVLNCPEHLRLILYRRFMMRIAEKIATEENISALVTGESLAQVASQTLENIRAVEAVTRLPVLRPLIGLDKEEIMQTARKMESYDISITSPEDCCTRFMPRNPETRANLQEVENAEKLLDIEQLVNRDVQNTEILDV